MISSLIILATLIIIQNITIAILCTNNKETQEEIRRLHIKNNNLYELIRLNQIELKNKTEPVMDRDYKDIPPLPKAPIPPTYQTSKEWF